MTAAGIGHQQYQQHARLFTGVAPAEPEDKRIEWAYPSPYDVDRPSSPGHFAETAHLRAPTPQWNLSKLARIWRSTKDESWPWVWYDRNPVDPHHAFTHPGPNTLALMSSTISRSYVPPVNN